MIGKVVGNSQWSSLPERNKPQDLPASAKNFWEGLLPRLSRSRSTDDSIISERQHSHGALQSTRTIQIGWGSITWLWWIASQPPQALIFFHYSMQLRLNYNKCKLHLHQPKEVLELRIFLGPTQCLPTKQNSCYSLWKHSFDVFR